MNKIIGDLTIAGLAVVVAVKGNAEQIACVICALAIITAVGRVLGE